MTDTQTPEDQAADRKRRKSLMKLEAIFSNHEHGLLYSTYVDMD